MTKTTSTSLVRSATGNKQQHLRELISLKREKLLALITKNEMLSVELDMIRQEYHVRVGALIQKSDQQDLDLMYYRNLLDLLHAGMSYEAAVEKLKSSFAAEQRTLDEEKEFIREETKIYEKREHLGDLIDLKQLKNLWKRLVSKFHPDLSRDPDEKKRREDLMKELNRAYEERDVEKLKALEKEAVLDNNGEATVEQLQEILVDVENQIIFQKERFKELQKTSWYTWKTKISRAKKKGEDIFADLERTLLDEVVFKMKQIENLHTMISNFRTHPKV